MCLAFFCMLFITPLALAAMGMLHEGRAQELKHIREMERLHIKRLKWTLRAQEPEGADVDDEEDDDEDASKALVEDTKASNDVP